MKWLDSLNDIVLKTKKINEDEFNKNTGIPEIKDIKQPSPLDSFYDTIGVNLTPDLKTVLADKKVIDQTPTVKLGNLDTSQMYNQPTASGTMSPEANQPTKGIIPDYSDPLTRPIKGLISSVPKGLSEIPGAVIGGVPKLIKGAGQIIQGGIPSIFDFITGQKVQQTETGEYEFPQAQPNQFAEGVKGLGTGVLEVLKPIGTAIAPVSDEGHRQLYRTMPGGKDKVPTTEEWRAEFPEGIIGDILGTGTYYGADVANLIPLIPGLKKIPIFGATSNETKTIDNILKGFYSKVKTVANKDEMGKLINETEGLLKKVIPEDIPVGLSIKNLPKSIAKKYGIAEEQASKLHNQFISEAPKGMGFDEWYKGISEPKPTVAETLFGKTKLEPDVPKAQYEKDYDLALKEVGSQQADEMAKSVKEMNKVDKEYGQFVKQQETEYVKEISDIKKEKIKGTKEAFEYEQELIRKQKQGEDLGIQTIAKDQKQYTDSIQQAENNALKMKKSIAKDNAKVMEDIAKIRAKDVANKIKGAGKIVSDMEYAIRSHPEKIVNQISKYNEDSISKIVKLMESGADDKTIAKELDNILKENIIDADILHDAKALSATKEIQGKADIWTAYSRNNEITLKDNKLTKMVIDKKNVADKLKHQMKEIRISGINKRFKQAGIEKGNKKYEQITRALDGQADAINAIKNSGDTAYIEAYSHARETLNDLHLLNKDTTKFVEGYFPRVGANQEQARLIKEAITKGLDLFETDRHVNQGLKSWQKNRIGNTAPMDLREGLDYILNSQIDTHFNNQLIKDVKQMLPLLEARGEKNLAELLRHYTRGTIGLDKSMSERFFSNLSEKLGDSQLLFKGGRVVDKLINNAVLTSVTSFTKNLTNFFSLTIPKYRKFAGQAILEYTTNPAMRELASKYTSERLFKNLSQSKILPSKAGQVSKTAYDSTQIMIRSSQKIVSELSFISAYKKALKETGSVEKAIAEGISAIGDIQGVYGKGGFDLVNTPFGKIWGKYMNFPAHMIGTESKILKNIVKGGEKAENLKVLSTQLLVMTGTAYILGLSPKEIAEWAGFGARKPIGIDIAEKAYNIATGETEYEGKSQGKAGKELIAQGIKMVTPFSSGMQKGRDFFQSMTEGKTKKPANLTEDIFPFMKKTGQVKEKTTTGGTIKDLLFGASGKFKGEESRKAKLNREETYDEIKNLYAQGNFDDAQALKDNWNEDNPNNTIKTKNKELKEYSIKYNELDNDQRRLVNTASYQDKALFLKDKFGTNNKKEVVKYIQEITDTEVITPEIGNKIYKAYKERFIK